jgi:hypothetical protein
LLFGGRSLIVVVPLAFVCLGRREVLAPDTNWDAAVLLVLLVRRLRCITGTMSGAPTVEQLHAEASAVLRRDVYVTRFSRRLVDQPYPEAEMVAQSPSLYMAQGQEVMDDGVRLAGSDDVGISLEIYRESADALGQPRRAWRGGHWESGKRRRERV